MASGRFFFARRLRSPERGSRIRPPRDTREPEKTPRLMLLLTNGPHGASEPSAVRCDTVTEPIKEFLAVFGDILCIFELI
jgi:hypothetical protein